VRRAAFVFVALGLLLTATAVLLVTWQRNALADGLLAGAAAASLVTAALLTLAGRRAPDTDPDPLRPLPSTSWSSAAVGIGVSLAVIGLVWGLYLVMIGLGIVIAGIAGLVREQRSLARVRAGAPIDSEAAA
jgi:hypothetical protein